MVLNRSRDPRSFQTKSGTGLSYDERIDRTATAPGKYAILRYRPTVYVWLDFTLITRRKIALIASTAICGCSAISHLKPYRTTTESES